MASSWRVAVASVTGSRHADAGEPSQDRHDVRVTACGALVAVVSDGAGSAAQGSDGAAMLCERVATRLQVFFDWGFVRDCSRMALAGACRSVRDGVIDARARLAIRAEDRDLSAFHATLVGVALMPGRGGIAFQIGDGAAVAMAGDGRWAMSPPENGEYADTTFFFTQPDWRSHLRFNRIGPEFNTVFVMTDGATDLALTRRGGAFEPHMPFFEPVGRFLAEARRKEGERALASTLDSPAARARSGDDKTLIWIGG